VIDPAILDAMLEAGASAEVIVAAVKAAAAREDARREAQRAGNARRQRRYRERLSGDETGDLFEGVDGASAPFGAEQLRETMESLPDAPHHAGPVPASTAPHALRPSGLRCGGPRNKSGVTEAEGDAIANPPPPAQATPGDTRNALRDATGGPAGVTGIIPPSLDKSPQTPKINPIPHAPVEDSPRKGSAGRRFPCPAGCDPADWRDLLSNRRTKRLAMTEAAYRKLLRDLAAQADDDWPPGRLLAHAAEKGWAQIFDPRDDQQGASRHGKRRPRHSTPGPRDPGDPGDPGEPHNPLVRAVLRSEARDDGAGGTGF